MEPTPSPDAQTRERLALHFQLFGAIMKGDVAALAEMIQTHGRDAIVKARMSYQDFTPLHYACTGNQLGVVEFLIENGADTSELSGTESSDDRFPPLYCALYEKCNLTILRHVLGPRVCLNPFSTESRCQSPLEHAIKRGCVSQARELVLAGANIYDDNSAGTASTAPLKMATLWNAGNQPNAVQSTRKNAMGEALRATVEFSRTVLVDSIVAAGCSDPSIFIPLNLAIVVSEMTTVLGV